MVLLIMFLCAGAQMASNCNIPAALKNAYESDVKYLALQRIDSQHVAYLDSIDIPYSYQDTIWQGLAAIYNLDSFAPRDSVFDIFCIHQDDGLNHSIDIGVNMTDALNQNWGAGQIATGNAALDSMLINYGFTVVGGGYIFAGAAHWTLNTAQDINIEAVCHKLPIASHVLSAVPEHYNYVAGGKVITYQLNGAQRLYDFKLIFGNYCPSGCYSYKDFQFEVENNCAVTYLGSSMMLNLGDSLPEPSNCYITTGINRLTKRAQYIYPNPANDLVTVNGLNGVFNYIITNIFGQTLAKGNVANHTQIPVKSLDAGMYIISFYNENGMFESSCKLVKQ